MLNPLGDLRYAARQFKRSPVFTITAVLTLALGIGGTTAIFTLMNAVMLKSLPVVDPSTLYRIGDGNDVASKEDRRIAGACSRIPCTASEGGDARVRRAGSVPGGWVEALGSA